MRIGIDCRVLSSEAAVRGMGRYTQQNIREILNHSADVELFLFVYENLRPENIIFNLDDPRIRLTYVNSGPIKFKPEDAGSAKDRNRLASHLAALIRANGIHVFHMATPFITPIHSAISACPVVATFYDAIPLVFPSDYFSDPIDKLKYYHSFQNILASQKILTISYSAKSDLLAYGGVNPDKIHVIYPYIDDTFDQSRKNDVKGKRLDLGKLPTKFILGVTGIHRSKNLSLLISAYDQYRNFTSSPLDLVIVAPNEWARRRIVELHGSRPQIHLLSDIADGELAELYRTCTAATQPSMYEGFGYPVAEAMSCGAAVIATSSSSIPEVAGNACILIDPSDVTGFARAIAAVTTDPALCHRLQQQSVIRSRQFRDGSCMGRDLLKLYADAIAESESSSREKPRPIGLWGSLPPLDCNVADYSTELSLEFSKTHEVRLFSDDNYEPLPATSKDISFCALDKNALKDLTINHIFQVGGRHPHNYIYNYINDVRGITVVHDLSVSSGYYFLAHAGGHLDKFRSSVIAPEGHDILEEYDNLRINSLDPSSSIVSAFFLKHLLLRWIINSSSKILVHTTELRERLLAAYPDACCEVIRMGVADQLPKLRYFPDQSIRDEFGVDSTGIIVGCFGIINPIKRIESIIRAFEQLCEDKPTSHLLIVGRASDRAYDRRIGKLISESNFANQMQRYDFVPSETLHQYMKLSDVIVNLRSSIRQGLSAILLRSMAIGKPTIISDVPDWRSVGPDNLIRVPLDDREIGLLAGHLKELANSRAKRIQLGISARRWYLQNATTQIMAADYFRALGYQSGSINEL